MPAYASLSSPSPEVVEEVVIYGRIVCVFSFGLFFESIWTKILQAQGDMRTLWRLRSWGQSPISGWTRC